MTTTAVTQLLRRALEDPAFAAQLGTDESVLNGYDLSIEERRALVAHDVEALLEIGVEAELLDAVWLIPRHG